MPKNVDIRDNNDGTEDIIINDSNITLKGLQYYAENTNILNRLGCIFDVATGFYKISKLI